MNKEIKRQVSKDKKNKKNRTVTDQYGTNYQLTGLIGEGGQGKVCSSNHPNTLVKVFTAKDSVKREQWFNRVKWILRQDLDGLSIASPKALIVSPVPGYVMELMDGLHPLASDMETSFTALSEGKGLTGFVQTGGLRRRLLILSEIASTLSKLHSKGLAYGDLSPANIFVSQNPEHSRVWLIDCDNLCTIERAGFGHIYTPGYGAPEVVRGESGVNSLSDAWSFAVIAYQILTHQHPLIGDRIEEGEPELEDKAYRGDLPWIGDLEDESNHSTGGIPMDLVASKRMRELFTRCFEQGKGCPWDRPTVTEWLSALDESISFIQQCHEDDCKSTFFKAATCPFCGKGMNPENTLVLSALVYSSDHQLDRNIMKTGHGRLINKGETVSLKSSPAGTESFRQSPDVCQVRLSDDGIALKVMPGQKVILQIGEENREVTRGLVLGHEKRSGRTYFVHIPIEIKSTEPSVHPVWAFRW
ncbi:TPA: lipopolysaccharide kinase InaA family protein [Vibrio parahaemolyticus]|uniref:serine/threonine protein kinase n=1 Tax=Vibrio parahaemolyticus TaxID=670 RepID=UPI00111DC717|nr:serine/threonine-protein kinase [Vibrio parahaemolyticus]TNY99756.1 protein kinase [Vibrio parahaemolyticus]HCH5600963.1 serine/threonine protein kinase [Vibrio parahaemolyticus]